MSPLPTFTPDERLRAGEILRQHGIRPPVGTITDATIAALFAAGAHGQSPSTRVLLLLYEMMAARCREVTA